VWDTKFNTHGWFRYQSFYVTYISIVAQSVYRLGYGLDDQGPIPFFSTPPRSDRFWGPPSLLCNGYREIFPQGVKLTTHLHLSRSSERVVLYFHSPIRLHGNCALTLEQHFQTSLNNIRSSTGKAILLLLNTTRNFRNGAQLPYILILILPSSMF
jgi:hypothetical protein